MKETHTLFKLDYQAFTHQQLQKCSRKIHFGMKSNRSFLRDIDCGINTIFRESLKDAEVEASMKYEHSAPDRE
jgi:hypothetical protein